MRFHQLFIKVVDTPTGITYSNKTGKFPITSSRGNKYILIWYNWDSNSIKLEPIKSKHKTEQNRAFKKLHCQYMVQGFKPQVHILDNEASNAFLETVEDPHINYQMTPPKHALSKCSRESHQNVERAFHECVGNSGSQLPHAPVVPTPTSHGHATHPAIKIQNTSTT